MLIPDALLLELLLIGGLVDLLEDVLEAAIILLQDGVLGAHVQGERLAQRELETGMGKSGDGLVGVILCLRNTASVLEFENLNFLRFATFGGEDQLQSAIALEDKVLGSVLVTEGVTTDNDGLLPAWH